MSGIRYPSQRKRCVKRLDRWTNHNMDGRIDPYAVCDACGFNSNTYMGSDVIYEANSRSLLGQFNAKGVSQRFSDVFLQEYVS